MSQLSRGGVTLSYDEAGIGDPPIVLVHGGMVNRTNFAPQLQHFSGRHRTVAVDLRGHGKSDAPQQDYTIAGFADDVAWMCRELNVSKPVVVGHSMGGLVTIEVAARTPDLPAAIVIMDSPVVPPAWFVEALRPLVAAMRTPAYRDAINQFMGGFIGFADHPDRRTRLLNDMMAAPQQVTASSLESYIAYDSVAAAAACKVPVLYISAGMWFTDVNRFKELCPQLVTAQTVGSGHYHQLEVPDQVNAMIDRFLVTALRPSK